MHRRNYLHAIVFLIIVISLWWLVYITVTTSYRRSAVETDIVYIHSLNKIIVDIYLTTGRPLHSQDDLIKSCYYPFPFPLSPNGGKVKVMLYVHGQEYEWQLEIAPTATGTTMRRHWFETRLPAETETYLRLKWLLTDPKMIVVQAQKWREEIKKGWSHFAEIGQHVAIPFETSLSLNSIPSFPTTEKQMADYVHWLERMEGQSPLLDSWGRPIQIMFSRFHIIGKSAGMDGIWGTQDDITFRVRRR